jgi:DNA-binding MurR/RpiR family transcriptional regulator
MQLMLASQTKSDCVALVFSHTGTNMDTLAIAEELKRNDCTMVVVTNGGRSTLARMADVILPVAVASTSYISEAFTSRIAQLLVVDLLYVALAKLLGDESVEHIEAMRNTIAKRKT